MDIQQALDFLSGISTNKQKELNAINVAIQILQDKFSAEFTSRDSAISQLENTEREKNDLLVEKSTLTNEKESLTQEVLEKTQTIANQENEMTQKLAEVESLVLEKEEKDAEILAKEEAIQTLLVEKQAIADELKALKATPVVDVVAEPIP